MKIFHAFKLQLHKGKLTDEALKFFNLHATTEQRDFQLVIWKKPSSKVIKLNIDGASKGNPGDAGIGGLFRNSNGDFIIGFASYLGTTTSIMVEAKAIYFGLHLAKEKN